MRARRYRRYTPEQREEAVRLVQVSGQTIAGVARDLGISEKTLWHWVQREEVGGGEEGKEPLTRGEREELVRLRRENRRLRMEREFLKKAAAFFAKEGERDTR
jgi:transposase